MLDVFNSDAFGIVPLTDTINRLKYAPGQIGRMALFTSTGVASTTVAIEERDGLLSLISPTARGGPGVTLDKGLRTLRAVPVPHFEINDAIMAEEVQGIRAWGQESAVDTVMSRVTERMQLHTQNLEVTEEYHRVGALKGIVTYADGTVLNLYTLFGVSAQTEVDFNLDAASPAPGALRRACAAVVRTMQDELGGAPLTGVGAVTSPEFYDALISHPEVRDTYLGYAQAADLRGGYAYGAFEFGGIRFEEYRGSVNGVSFVAANKAHFFPMGVPGLFRTYYAPADYNETVNTIGQARYVKQYTMPNDKGIHFDSQTNPLILCLRPRVLVQGKLT